MAARSKCEPVCRTRGCSSARSRTMARECRTARRGQARSVSSRCGGGSRCNTRSGRASGSSLRHRERDRSWRSPSRRPGDDPPALCGREHGDRRARLMLALLLAVPLLVFHGNVGLVEDVYRTVLDLPAGTKATPATARAVAAAPRAEPPRRHLQQTGARAAAQGAGAALGARRVRLRSGPGGPCRAAWLAAGPRTDRAAAGGARRPGSPVRAARPGAAGRTPARHLARAGSGLARRRRRRPDLPVRAPAVRARSLPDWRTRGRRAAGAARWDRVLLHLHALAGRRRVRRPRNRPGTAAVAARPRGPERPPARRPAPRGVSIRDPGGRRAATLPAPASAGRIAGNRRAAPVALLGRAGARSASGRRAAILPRAHLALRGRDA